MAMAMAGMATMTIALSPVDFALPSIENDGRRDRIRHARSSTCMICTRLLASKEERVRQASSVKQRIREMVVELGAGVAGNNSRAEPR